MEFLEHEYAYLINNTVEHIKALLDRLEKLEAVVKLTGGLPEEIIERVEEMVSDLELGCSLTKKLWETSEPEDGTEKALRAIRKNQKYLAEWRKALETMPRVGDTPFEIRL